MKTLILEAIAGREFELAQRYCGITEGRRGDREHHQPCPFCQGKDRFNFSEKCWAFFCRQCGFGGDLITLMMAVNAITYRKSLETLADELGIVLPEQPKRPKCVPLGTVWEQNKNDVRMTLASLVLVHLRFVPATDGVDFQAADIDTVRKYAARLTGHRLDEIVGLLASRYGDRQKAWAALECLYTGKEIAPALREINVNRAISGLRMFAAKERRDREKEIETEIERIRSCRHSTK
jgi:hypothetical protein